MYEESIVFSENKVMLRIYVYGSGVSHLIAIVDIRYSSCNITVSLNFIMFSFKQRRIPK